MEAQNKSSNNNPGQSVTWQVCFWALVTLAICTMAQPCGRSCGLPSRYRLYLRSSPFFCLADTFTSILRLLITSIALRISVTKSIRRLRDYRLPADDGDDLDPDDDLSRLSNMTWLRWIFFIVATLPPAVKLMAMTRIPWTQALGAMFLSSYLGVELFIISSPLATEEGHSLPYQEAKHWILDVMEISEATLGALALLTHFGIIARIRISLAINLVEYDETTQKSGQWPLLAFIFACYILLFLVMMMLLFFPDGMATIKAIYLFCVTVAVLDWGPVVACFSLFSNLLYTALGYGFMYDSIGTVNPGWTGVFG